MKDNGIITLGDRWWEAPREYWGGEDWERYLDTPLHQPPAAEQPPVPRTSLVDFSLLDRREQRERWRRVDANTVLEKFGLRG